MTARAVIVTMLVLALAAGALMYYLQEYYYYREIAGNSVTMTRADGAEESVPVQGFRGIDAGSSPIRYRACFTLAAPATDFQPYEGADPGYPPRWFDCFDAAAIGAALDEGRAEAVLGQKAVSDGIDRVVAIFPDGRAFAWTQIDPCGSLVDEDSRPAHCQGS